MERASFDWEILEKLRMRFLKPESISGVYWESKQDLLQYHISFGKRIGWKWRAVWEELGRLGWKPESKILVDWGCGSGVAILSFLEAFGSEAVEKIFLWDHSTLACEFAKECIREIDDQVSVDIKSLEEIGDRLPETLCLASHVLNELSHNERQALGTSFRQAKQVVWVEPGNFESSRLLIAQRELLLKNMSVIAPCVCQDGCPMLKEQNSRHWCHFFARSPQEAFTEGEWARFASLLEIDLRSLPYSYLAMNRSDLEKLESPENVSRVIGKPRQYKGFAKILSCDRRGLNDFELQKRDDKALWKSIKKGKDGSLYEWQKLGEGRIKQGTPSAD